MMHQNLVDAPIATPEDGAQPLPEKFLDWQLSARAHLFEALERQEMPRSFSAHLPAVSTLGSGSFPIHMANKGVGMLPKDELIPDLLREIDDCMEWAAQRSWNESQARRIATARLLYDHADRVDPRRFGLIEIFRGSTFENLQRNPQATLLFTGDAPKWLSFQVNCVAEIIEPGDPRFEFIVGMRLLFESDRFHVQQLKYPMGYVFWVHEVIEKTPLFGRDGHQRGRKK